MLTDGELRRLTTYKKKYAPTQYDKDFARDAQNVKFYDDDGHVISDEDFFKKELKKERGY